MGNVNDSCCSCESFKNILKNGDKSSLNFKYSLQRLSEFKNKEYIQKVTKSKSDANKKNST